MAFGPDALFFGFVSGMLCMSGLAAEGHDQRYRLLVSAALLCGPWIGGRVPLIGRHGAVPLSMVLAAMALYYLASSRDAPAAAAA